MKSVFKQLPLALAVSTCLAIPAVHAGGHGGHKRPPAHKSDYKSNKQEHERYSASYTKVKTVSKNITEQDIYYYGDVHVEGKIKVDAHSTASVNSHQANQLNKQTNVLLDNHAKTADGVMKEANGNVSVNVAAGDNNQQDNSTAMAKVDAYFVFGASDAVVATHQDNEWNSTLRLGGKNKAGLGSNAIAGASGNIAFNSTAGNSNQQQNNTAISSASGPLATATVSSEQTVDRNTTLNAPLIFSDLSDDDLYSESGRWDTLYEAAVAAPKNYAQMDQGALAGASGNVAVNISAGSNNQQSNSLSIAHSAAKGSGW